MQSSSSSTNGQDGVVSHLLGAVRDAALEERSLEFLLVLGVLSTLDNSGVSLARDLVGLANQGNLVLILDNASSLNSALERLEVLLLKGIELDVVRDLAIESEDGRLGVGSSEFGKSSVDLGGESDFVDIVELEGIVNGDGETRPDDVLGIDGRNEEDGLGGLDVVGVVAVGHVGTGQIVKETALTAGC